MFRQHQGRTYPFRFRFLAHFTLMLDFFFKSKYWFGDIKGGAKKKTQCLLCFFFFFVTKNWCGDIKRGEKKKKQSVFFFFFFFCWAQFFAPPSEWRPRRPPIP